MKTKTQKRHKIPSTEKAPSRVPQSFAVHPLEKMHVEQNGKYEKDHNESRCKLHEETLHGSALVPAPVGITVRTGNRAETLGFAFLHQDHNSHDDADDDHDDRQ
jgi:hypothetical protein